MESLLMSSKERKRLTVMTAVQAGELSLAQGAGAMNEVAAGQTVILQRHAEVPGLLRHPGRFGFRRATRYPHSSSAQVDKEQDVDRY